MYKNYWWENLMYRRQIKERDGEEETISHRMILADSQQD
jgi:hypothetical protein